MGLKPGFNGFMDFVLELRAALGVPHTLKDFKVDDSKFDLMSQMAPKDPTAGGNPLPIDAAACLKLYRAAYEGRL
jgi:alcohol dehydrogenase